MQSLFPDVSLEAGSQTIPAKFRSGEAHRVPTWSWNGEGAWEWESQERGVGQRGARYGEQEAGLLSQDRDKQTRSQSVKLACQNESWWQWGRMTQGEVLLNKPGDSDLGQMEAGPERSEFRFILKLVGCGWQKELGTRVSPSGLEEASLVATIWTGGIREEQGLG